MKKKRKIWTNLHEISGKPPIYLFFSKVNRKIKGKLWYHLWGLLEACPMLKPKQTLRSVNGLWRAIKYKKTRPFWQKIAWMAVGHVLLQPDLQSPMMISKGFFLTSDKLLGAPTSRIIICSWFDFAKKQWRVCSFYFSMISKFIIIPQHPWEKSYL